MNAPPILDYNQWPDIVEDFDRPPRQFIPTCDATSAPHGPYDAATACLCLMFVPDDGGRLEQHRDIERFAGSACLRGADEEWIGYAVDLNSNQTHILSNARERELIEAAGFTVDGLYFQGLWIHGWEATA